MIKTIFHKVCPVCKEHYTTTVRHQKYCSEVCRYTKVYNENYAVTPVKRAPQDWLDRKLGRAQGGSQDDIYREALRTALHEEIQKIKDAGLKIDETKLELNLVRLHSATRNWATVYYPCTRNREKGGVLMPAGKYCFAFNRMLMKHTRFAYGQTVMHELLHVVAHQMDKKRGHGKLWQNLCYIVNKKYGYDLSRTTSRDKFDKYDKAACSM